MRKGHVQQDIVLAEDVRRDAYRLPAGRARDEMLSRASVIENACRAQECMESSGLHPHSVLGGWKAAVPCRSM